MLNFDDAVLALVKGRVKSGNFVAKFDGSEIVTDVPDNQRGEVLVSNISPFGDTLAMHATNIAAAFTDVIKHRGHTDLTFTRISIGEYLVESNTLNMPIVSFKIPKGLAGGTELKGIKAVNDRGVMRTVTGANAGYFHREIAKHDDIVSYLNRDNKERVPVKASPEERQQLKEDRAKFAEAKNRVLVEDNQEFFNALDAFNDARSKSTGDALEKAFSAIEGKFKTHNEIQRFFTAVAAHSAKHEISKDPNFEDFKKTVVSVLRNAKPPIEYAAEHARDHIKSYVTELVTEGSAQAGVQIVNVFGKKAD